MRARTGTIVVVAALAAACGTATSSSRSTRNDDDVLSVIQAAAKTNSATRSMRVEGHLAQKLDGVTVAAGQPPVSNDTEADFAGDMQTEPLEARLALSNMNVNGQSLGGGITELVTPDAFFMKMPQLAAQTGKPWISVTFDEMKSASGIDFKDLISQAQQMQPSQYVAQLAAAGDVVEVGTEDVNGVTTTHYSGTVPLDEVLSHFTSSVREKMAPLMKSAGFTGSQVDIWLDGKGLIRRARSVSEGGKGSISMSMDVLDYGVTVDVTPPPANRVVDLGKLSSGGSFG